MRLLSLGAHSQVFGLRGTLCKLWLVHDNLAQGFDLGSNPARHCTPIALLIAALGVVTIGYEKLPLSAQLSNR